jgi:hypothetical protein
VITIAEASQQAIDLALLRHKCHRLTHDESAPAEVRAAARALGRTLDVLAAIRGTRRDNSGLQAQAAALYSVVGTCKHLGLDPFGYLREAMLVLFCLGDEPSEDALAAWLPDAWQGRPEKVSATAAIESPGTVPP